MSTGTHPRKPYAVITDGGRVVRADVLDAYVFKAEDDQAAGEASRQIDDPFATAGSYDQLLRPRLNPMSLARVLELNTWHGRCCKVKAQDVAAEGWTLIPTVDQPSAEQKARVERFFEELPTPRNADLHEAPINNVFERAQYDFEAIGYGAIELVRRQHQPDGPLTTIAHVPAHTLRLARDRKRFVQERGGRRRWFKLVESSHDVHYETGKIAPLGTLPKNERATEILFWANYSPNDETYGAPDHIPALGAIYGDRGRLNYNLAFFENYGMPAYAVFVTGDFDPGDEDEDGMNDVERAIQKHFEVLRGNPHANLVLTLPTRDGIDEAKVDIRFERLSTEMKEASFRLYRRDNAHEVLASHGVPAARVGAFEQGAANREASEVYKRSVIDPRQRTIVSMVNRYILQGGLSVTDWRWQLTELDNRDESHDLDMLLKLEKAGAISKTELRAHFAGRFGLPLDLPDPEADGIRDELRTAVADLRAAIGDDQGDVDDEAA